MKLTVLGSGAYEPELKRQAACHLVQTAKQNLVFDFGRGALGQLLKAGVRYCDIDVIFITHLHADHWAELTSLLFVALTEPQGHQLRNKDLIIYGPQGIKEAMKQVYQAFNLNKYHPIYQIEIEELNDRSVIKGRNWQVQAYKIEHSESRECLAFRIESYGKILTYSGDSQSCLALRQACDGADLALLESTLMNGPKEEGHMTVKEAIDVAKDARVRKLVLTHIAGRILKKGTISKNLKKEFTVPIVIAKDLQSFEI